MYARCARLLVAIVGLLALVVPWHGASVGLAATACSSRQQVLFLNGGDVAIRRIITAIACATSQVRQLVPRSPVHVRLVPADALRSVVAQAAELQAATIAISGTVTTLQLLGAVPPNEDLAAIERSQYSSNSAADYDPLNKILYVRQSKTPFGPLDRAVISHEYTHALQDQYFGLINLLTDRGGGAGHNSDALLARQAIVEGDAFNTMLMFATTFSRQDQVAFNQQLQRSAPTAMDFAHDRIGFPAAQGTLFIKYIMAAAAKGKQGRASQNAAVSAVNNALSNPPTTTREVLNPALYVQHARQQLSQPAPEVTIGQDWRMVNSDVLGAFGIDDLFSQHNVPTSTAQEADRAALAWQGDRWVIYQNKGKAVLVWRAHFDSKVGVDAFERALLAYTADRFHATLNGAAPVDWRTRGFAMSLRDHGADVAVSIGSSADLQSICVEAVSQLGFK